MEILIVLLIILAVTRILGELAERVGQPALVGELVAGILLGIIIHAYPGTFPAFSNLGEDPAFVAVTDLGVFFLMLLAGVEMKPRELTERSGRSIEVALGGMILPLAVGVGLGWIIIPESSYRFAQVLFLGTALAITAVPVAVKILMDLGRLESRAGKTIVAAAIIDDILSLILLAALTAVIRTGEFLGAGEVALLVGRIALFFGITVVVARFLLGRIFQPLVEKVTGSEFEFSILILVALGFGVLAEILGMHFIIGAFVAGLFFRGRDMEQELYDDVKEKVSALTKGFLAPIFFASIGLRMELDAITAIPMIVGLLIAVAILGKLVGAGLPALRQGLSLREASTVGVGMSARGAVELIIAGVALEAGLFSQPEPTPPVIANLFSAVVIMAVVTTVFAPIALRVLLVAGSGNEGEEPEADGDDSGTRKAEIEEKEMPRRG